MKSILTILLSAILFSATLVSVAGPPNPMLTNTLYGFYFSNITLTAAPPGPDYILIGDVFIQPGVTLTIEPGVTVHFTANFDTLNGEDYFNDSEIIIDNGILNAVGTPTDSITFTSTSAAPQPGDWGQIKLKGASQGTIEYANLEYGGIGINARDNSSVVLQHSTIRHMNTDGLASNNSELWVSRCSIHDVAEDGLDQDGGNVTLAESSLSDILGSGISQLNGTLSVSDCTIARIGALGILSNGGDLTATRDTIDQCVNQGILASNATGELSSNTLTDCRGGIQVSSSSCAVRWNNIDSCTDYGIYVSGSGVERPPILGNTIRGIDGDGYGIRLITTASDSVLYCEISDCASSGIRFERMSTDTVLVDHCLVVRCFRGVYLAGYNAEHGIASQNTLVSCQIGLELYRTSGTPSANIVNNIIASSALSGVRLSNPPFDDEIRFNNVWSGTGTNFSGTSCDTACTTINPLFVDPANDDYHLLSHSPIRVLGEDGTQMGRYGPDPGDVTSILDPDPVYKALYLVPAYPNPFREATTITLMARTPGIAELDLFNVAGRLLRFHHGIELIQGANKIQVWRGDLPAGVYLYRVTGLGTTGTGKLVVTD